MFGLGVYKTLLSSVPVFTKSKDNGGGGGAHF